ncbi:protein phosphatase CheZ [Microvirga terricola]|nr:protein phosphatase CheZ [Microvirga terricola]
MSRAEAFDEKERQAEIFSAIATLRKHAQPGQDSVHSLLELQGALRLKVELDAIAEAIQRTKQEIATLHYAGAQGREMARVTDELGAIVLGTETATHAILAAAEEIDEIAGDLATRLHSQDSDMARGIVERVVGIFEACNFQDITGQRISKIVTAMQFVEDRVVKMIEIWGGLENFKDIPPSASPEREGDKALLNGPTLRSEDGTSQDEIDSFFK